MVTEKLVNGKLVALCGFRWLSERVFTPITGFNGCPQKDADGETWKVKVQLDEDCWETFSMGWWFV